MAPSTRIWRGAFAGCNAEELTAVKAISTAAREMGAAGRTLFCIELCAEEFLVNLSRHGPILRWAIAATLEVEPSRFILTLEDNGAFFDPSSAPIRENVKDLDAAEPGGWGLQLIRSLANHWEYRRTEAGNMLVLEFIR